MRRTTTLGALAAGLALIAAAPASAHHPKPKPVKVDTVAGGLDNPRHIAVAKDGDLWVAESGTGGGVETEDKSCFDSAEGRACTGDTGAITRIDKRGTHPVVTGLASFAPPSGDSAIGPHGIFVDGHDVYFTNGGPTGPMREGEIVLRDPTLVREDFVSRFYGTLRKVVPFGRRHVQIADIWAFERDNNPDAEVGNPLIDSNPVDVYADDGRFFVADAGGNTLLRAKWFNRISTVAVFPNRNVDDPFNPDPNADPIPMQAVPTAVVKGPDGALYVSQLTGFPFPVGAANVYRVDPKSGKVTVYASGFTNIIDLDFGRDGTLYVLEIDQDGLVPPLGPSPEGALFTVGWKGKQPKRVDVPAGKLLHPGGIAVGKRGDLFVTNRSDEAGDGEVLRIDLG
jgi:hypothetical protein